LPGTISGQSAVKETGLRAEHSEYGCFSGRKWLTFHYSRQAADMKAIRNRLVLMLLFSMFSLTACIQAILLDLF
jgi:hypothetical protein